MPRIEKNCNRRTKREPARRCVAPGSAGRDPDDGFVERPHAEDIHFRTLSECLYAGDSLQRVPLRCGPSTAERFARRGQRHPHHQSASLTGSDPFVPRVALYACPRTELAILTR